MIQFQIIDIFLALMALTRIGAFFFMVPIFGTGVPVQAKVGLMGAMAVMMVPMMYSGVSIGSVPTSIIGLVIAVMGEMLIGFLMGFSVKLLFYTVEFAADMIARETALMRARSFNPSLESQSSVLGPLYFYLAAMVFYATGTHLEILGAFARSYDFVPAGLGVFSYGSIDFIVRATSGVFSLGLQMAAPIIAYAFVVNFVIAILGRVAAKFNVLVISFGVRIVGGLFLLYLLVDLMLSYIMIGLEGTAARMIEFIVF